MYLGAPERCAHLSKKTSSYNTMPGYFVGTIASQILNDMPYSHQLRNETSLLLYLYSLPPYSLLLSTPIISTSRATLVITHIILKALCSSTSNIGILLIVGIFINNIPKYPTIIPSDNTTTFKNWYADTTYRLFTHTIARNKLGLKERVSYPANEINTLQSY